MTRLGKNSLGGAVLECREGLYVAYDREGTVELLLLLNQADVLAHPRFKDAGKRRKALEDGLDEIVAPVAKHLSEIGSSITLNIDPPTFPGNLRAAELLYRFHLVDLD